MSAFLKLAHSGSLRLVQSGALRMSGSRHASRVCAPCTRDARFRTGSRRAASARCRSGSSRSPHVYFVRCRLFVFSHPIARSFSIVAGRCPDAVKVARGVTAQEVRCARSRSKNGKGLRTCGIQIQKATYAVSHLGARMFATLDLATPVGTGVSLAVGIRNSSDQSVCLGFCAGARVFVCSNLAFRSELLVSRKHTRFGQDRFREAIAQAVGSLGQFQQVEADRIRRFQHLTLSDERAESLILRSFERGFVSYRALPAVIQEWRQPSFDFGSDPSLWRLFNAWTTVLAPVAKRSPQRFAALTMDLQRMLDEHLPPPVASGMAPVDSTQPA